MTRLSPALLLAGAIALGVSACVAGPTTQELSLEAACLQHFENDPLGRDRCRMSGETRSGSVPDVRPEDLPIRTGQPSD